MSEILSRDQNYRTVGAGVNPADLSDVQMLRVDPATDRVLLEAEIESVSATPASMDKRDQNYRPTMYGVSDADGETLVPIRTNEEGAILADVIME